MKSNFKTKAINQLQYIPVKISGDSFVEPVFYKGSAHITSIALADGLMEVPPETIRINKGEKVYVRQL